MINRVVQIWKNKWKILEGFKNSVIKKADIEAVAFERMSICEKCPLLDTEGKSCMIPGTAPCCSACGCKLSYKTRSLSSHCAHPDGPRWNAELSQEEEDELYSEIGYDPDAEV